MAKYSPKIFWKKDVKEVEMRKKETGKRREEGGERKRKLLWF